MKSLLPAAIALVSLSVGAAGIDARRADLPRPVPTVAIAPSPLPDAMPSTAALRTTASANTTVLYSENFDTGALCDPSGWTEVDLTAQLGDFFHVTDYAGLFFGPLRGAKSLWCGLAAGGGVFCDYVTLPGYGNNWDQAFCTKACQVYTGTVAVDYLTRWDSEPNYDATTLEYNTDCSGQSWWYSFAGGLGDLDGIGDSFRHDTFSAPAGAVKIRLRFQSDNTWSDQDGLWPTNGAIHIDSLSVSDASGLRLAVEDFEGEPVNATSATDWESCTPPGFGSYAFVLHGASVLQEDPCVRDVSCLWGFFENSTRTYACGGHPEQKVVPRHNDRGQYLNNEIWSPLVPLSGTGNVFLLRFSAYRDIPLDGLIFYIWHVRSIVNGCPGVWKDRNFVYYGGQKDWFINTQSIGDLIAPGATQVQVALGAIDECKQWCGIYEGMCHSQAPLLDNVKLLRIEYVGPQWSIADIEQFQDNFASDGTITGTVRADMARDILPTNNLNIIPGDSAVVTVSDGAGLADDGALGGKKIYGYVSVWPLGQSTKTGADLSGGARWPLADIEVIGGVTWTKLRLDQCILNGSPVANKYCLDLKDDLFTPGDTVCFFYCAENTSGVRTYAFGSSLAAQGDDINQAAANAAEFTCLPAGGWSRGGNVLYVDGMDGRGAQPYWDTTFEQLGILDEVDRYDVRGPSSGVSNRLDGRVKNIAQLLDCYHVILWECGDLAVTLGQGNGTPEKTNDYDLINSWLAGLQGPGGMYLCGDDVAEQLKGYSSPSAVTFRTTYLTYNLTTGYHRPTYGINPAGIARTGGCFDGDTVVIWGGCPLLNDFDVMTPTGSTTMEMSYGAPAANNGAVIAKRTTNSHGVSVGVMMSGFSFIYIRDDESDGVSDRADHLHDILTWLGNAAPLPTSTGPVAANSLSQNYPNPFNPATTIAFSIKQRGRVSLRIYDVAGRVVRTLADESFEAGPHTKAWDGRNDSSKPVSSGVYFYRLVAPGFEQTRKMVLLK